MPNLSCARPVVILRVRSGVDIRIDPQRDACGAAHAGGQDGEHVEFLGALDVDLGDVLGQGEAQLAFALADTGEHDPVGRDAGLARAAQFAFADHIGARTLAREQPQHGEPVVRLHRVVDVRVEPGIGQCGGERTVAAAHGGGE